MVVGGCVPGRTAAAVVAVSIVTLLTSSTAYGAQPLGALTQLPGTAGCFTPDGASEDGAGTCSQARGLEEGESAAVSPDGANVYLGSYGNFTTVGPGYAVFKRNKSTGALTQLSGKAGCFTSDGSSNAGTGTCTKARGLLDSSGDGHDVVFTANGKLVYIAADGSPASLLIFRRNASTGALTQLSGTAGCITTDGTSQDGAGTCKTDAHLLDASGLTLSSDDRFLYVTGTGGSHQIEVFSRNKTTGALSDIECISQAPAPSGCHSGRVVGDTQFIALTPDGKHAYAGQYAYGLSVFDRNPSTGLLTQKSGKAGCITDDGKDDTGAATCTAGRVTLGTFPLLVTPNGKWLYDTGYYGFSTFRISSDGTLTQLAGTDGCMTADGKDNTGASTCAVGRAVDSPYGGVISSDGRSLYISDYGGNEIGGVAVFLLSPQTGVATQLAGLAGCITSDGSSGFGGQSGKCTNGRALGYGYGMTISPDGKSVYQATDADPDAGLAIYHRVAPPPQLSGLQVSPSRRSLHGHKLRLRISYTLSVADKATFTIKRSGHKVRGKIVKSGSPGANGFTFNGRIGGHALGVGRYQLVATPAGGKPKKAKFTLTR
jgi:DNA-binding beta-propeller fold protein YncE